MTAAAAVATAAGRRSPDRLYVRLPKGGVYGWWQFTDMGCFRGYGADPFDDRNAAPYGGE